LIKVRVIRESRSSQCISICFEPCRFAPRPSAALADNDGHGFFGALGGVMVTRPTLANVNDFRAILIGTNDTI
jgi:hypothetical protein